MNPTEAFKARCAAIETSANDIVYKTCNDDEKEKQAQTKIEFLVHLCATYQEQAAHALNQPKPS